jgi:hypothetical protein
VTREAFRLVSRGDLFIFYARARDAAAARSTDLAGAGAVAGREGRRGRWVVIS